VEEKGIEFIHKISKPEKLSSVIQKEVEDAVKEILRNGGTQFDPEVVQAFERAWMSGKVICRRSEVGKRQKSEVRGRGSRFI